MKSSEEQQTVRRGCQVRMHFSLGLSDGTEVVSTFGEAPESVVIGDGSLTEGLETAIIGLKTGDHKTIELSPEQAFGRWEEDKLQWMPRTDFSPELVLEPGLAIAFETPSGLEVPGTITEVGEERVSVDFNHPLAGSEVVFSVEILEVGKPQP